MIFKNAIKIWMNRFGLAWSLVLYMLLFALVLGSLGLVLILPVFRALDAAGILERASKIFESILNGSVDAAELGTQIQSVWAEVVALFQDNHALTLNTTLTFFGVVIVYKFLLGYYELPLYETLEGAMSAGADYRFAAAFVSKLGLSGRFVLVKIVITTLYDAAFYGFLYLMLGLFFIPDATVWAAIVVVLYIVVFQTLRYMPLAFWGARVVVGKEPVFASLWFSLKKAARHFGTMFLCFFATWSIIITVNLFIGIFTFGVGLVITIPASMLFVCVLNMTLFYEKTGKRYYADGQIVTPHSVKDVLL